MGNKYSKQKERESKIKKNALRIDSLSKLVTFLFINNMEIEIPFDIQHLCALYIGDVGDIKQIKLEYYSHRKCYGGFHPRYIVTTPVIFGSINARFHYKSAINSNFKKNEPDWIIFKIKQKGLIIPKVIRLQSNSVKSMNIYIGSTGLFGKSIWIPCKPNPIDISTGYAYIDGLDILEIMKIKKKMVKIEFVENQGDTKQGAIRFIVDKFELHGYVFWKQ